MNTHNQTYPGVARTAPEKRQHRRSRSDFLRLTFLGVEHVAVNWSEGGALIADRHPNVEVGAAILGVAVIGPASHRFRFSAEVVRREAQHISLRFVNLSPALQRALSSSAE
jgi:hypothetical protein